jgi:hypothetical protein
MQISKNLNLFSIEKFKKFLDMHIKYVYSVIVFLETKHLSDVIKYSRGRIFTSDQNSIFNIQFSD